MCRLLLVKSKDDFPIVFHLKQFAEIAKYSKEYQGHGWGCAYLVNGTWNVYKHIKPIWEDELDKFGKTRYLIAHARSAFRNEEIRIENNMPFRSDDFIFAFNGELRGVRLRADGRIGAEKIFNVILRFHNADSHNGFDKAINIITRRTQYVRAMNIIMAHRDVTYVASIFNEDPDYFTMHFKETAQDLLICSEAYPGENGWQPIPNNTRRIFTK